MKKNNSNTNKNMEEKEMIITNKKICERCGKEISVEVAKLAHRIPLSEGGKNDFVNMIVLCEECYTETEDYEIEVEENTKKARAAEQERLAKLRAEEEAAEEAMQEKVEELVEKFFEETSTEELVQNYLCTDDIKRDYLCELFDEECNNSISFKEFILEFGYLGYYWDKDELREYAENSGYSEEEAEKFVEVFTLEEVSDYLDYDFAQTVYEEIKND